MIYKNKGREVYMDYIILIYKYYLGVQNSMSVGESHLLVPSCLVLK